MRSSEDTLRADSENSMPDGWRILIKNIEDSLDSLEDGIEEAESMNALCIPEWCTENENIMIDLAQSFSSIGESGWTSSEDSARIRALKRRLHDLYRRHKSISGR